MFTFEKIVEPESRHKTFLLDPIDAKFIFYPVYADFSPDQFPDDRPQTQGGCCPPGRSPAPASPS